MVARSTKREKPSHPGPGLQIIHPDLWHHKGNYWKAQVIFILHTDVVVSSRFNLQRMLLPIWLPTDPSEGREHEANSLSVKGSENACL